MSYNNNVILDIYNDVDDGVYHNINDDHIDYEYEDMVSQLLKNMEDYIHDQCVYIGEKMNRENLEKFLNTIL